ncbi:MAG: hypothetical protein V3V31_13245 [Methylococcales bacterium]
MKKSNRHLLQPLIWSAVFLLGQYAGPCFAEDLGGQNFEELSIVENDDLEGMRGGDFDINTTVSSQQTLTATVTGGDFDADSISNGNITFQDQAFNNFGGIGLVVGNTGNNNAINASLGVAIHLE